MGSVGYLSEQLVTESGAGRALVGVLFGNRSRDGNHKPGKSGYCGASTGDAKIVTGSNA